jgi:hypothetical protein
LADTATEWISEQIVFLFVPAFERPPYGHS